MPKRPPLPPTVKDVCANMAELFRRRVGPERCAQRGWQKDIERETEAWHPQLRLAQSVVSDVQAGKPHDYQLSTLLKIRAYIGCSLDELVGLAEAAPDSASPELPSNAEILRRLELLERERRAAPSEPATRSRVQSRKK